MTEDLDITRNIHNLPILYREVFVGLWEGDEADYLARDRELACEEIERIYEIAIDLLNLMTMLEDGAVPLVISDDHRHVARLALVEGFDVEITATSIAQTVKVTRQLIDEVSKLLIPGNLNLIRVVLGLDQPFAAVFSRIFFNGETPKHIALDCGCSEEDIRQMWDTAIDRMANATN